METKDLDYIVSNSKTLSEDTEAPEQLVDLAGFQVTRAELFAHTREPAVTIWPTRIKFNMACLRRFPHATHIQILIHPDQGARRRRERTGQSGYAVQNLCRQDL